MRSIILLMGVLCSLATFAQPSQFIRCRTHESMQEFRATHPGAESDEHFEAWLGQKKQQLQQFRLTAFYTIPVIFHIVHNGEAVGTGSNLSQAQIQRQLNQLNADFANLSGSTNGVAADMEIQFCLATVDEVGSPLAEPGIDRVNRNTEGWNAPPYDGLASNSYVDVTIMPGSIWDPTKYYNIWTLSLSGTLLGKATFPSSSTIPDLPAVSNDNATHSGVFVAYQSVGSICTPGSFGSSAGLGRTLTHETGHYLGLRHIWGDAFCGNDFVADTPPQDGPTSGCPPVGALNGCAPSAVKMFENYMDYTDDACVSTLTADQKARMQVVMLNSPRRMQLPGAASCQTVATNSVKYNYICAQRSETGTLSTCPRYRDVSVNLVVASSANGNATLNFINTGTATANVDYVLMPSTINFTSGDNLPKTLTIRIWDDAVVETDETIILSYTITGTGVVPATSDQVFTLTIDDDDLAPQIDNAGTVVLLNQDFGTSGGTFPTGWSPFLLGGTNRWVVSSNGGAGITGQAAHITSDAVTKPLAYDDNVTSDALLRTPVINTTGLSNATLNFTYKCNGEEDAGGVYDFGFLMYSFNGTSFSTLLDPSGSAYIFVSESNATTISIPLPANLMNTTFQLGFRWNNDNNTGDDPPFLIDDIVVSYLATQIESQTTNPGTENIFAGQDVYILSDGDNQLLARVQNPSVSLGCITGNLTQVGTGRILVNTTAGSYLRTEKVIQLTPTVANGSVTHTTTIYFTVADLSAWVSAGVPLNTLKILKVDDGTNLSGTLNASNSEIITPSSFSDQSASGYYAFTGNFTGFSHFMLASPNIALPVDLLTFEAKPVRKSIVLNWSTSQEINNKGFVIERSLDGNLFERIGWLDGRINSSSRIDYIYTDNFVQPGVTYYYRLRQTDLDAHEKLTTIRQARISEGGIALTVGPIPAKDQLMVFISGSREKAEVTLVNMQGQTIRRWRQVNASGSPLTLSVEGIASGMYLLQVQLPGVNFTRKLVIE
ncbi:MAG: T9SS type A sorting domain-containing protein [Chitinophagaceae bacterium]|nr:T9SS type A sorting domain-containing protein [Chitinophagaceae bacterium]